jgi:tight adherence protein C
MNDLTWLKVVSLALMFCAVAVTFLAVGQRDARPIRQLGLRGLRRRRALAQYDLWRVSEPSVRWLATAVSRTLSERFHDRLEAQLVRAGDPLGLEPEELVVLTGLCVLMGASLGILYVAFWGGNAMAPLVFGVGASIAPSVRIDSLGQERTQQIQRGLPASVDLMCLGLSAGLDFPGAIRQIVEKSAQKSAPLIDELSLVLSELQLGKTRREALELFALRNPLDSVKEFVGFVVQSEEEGNPLAQILSVQATVARQRRGVRAEEMAGQATLKIIAPVGLVMMSVFILIAGPLALQLSKELNAL